MVVDIKMCRFDNVPWGFRLVGGSDFEYPLTVVKVNEDSIAEEAGLRVGDIIVRINDTATSPLTHEEADNVIRHCGNVFYFGVYREDNEEEAPKIFPISQTEYALYAPSYIQSNDKSPTSIPEPNELEIESELAEDFERPCSVLSENTETKIVEEEIAAVLSGETEMLKEHNTLGVNFYRLFPKPGVCMSSDVLRSLNEEAIKTKAEKDKENKKWTTFLQKPNRPVPKSKQQLEAERRAANAYKVKIVKSKPKSPEPVKPIEPEAKPEEIIEAEPVREPTPEPEVEEPTPADSEVPNLEDNPPQDKPSNVCDKLESIEEEKSDKEKEDDDDAAEEIRDDFEAEQIQNDVDNVIAKEESPIKLQEAERQKTEEELALERQLSDVQKQLAALSSLPSTIQSTLDAVTKQLAVLLPAFKLQQQIQTGTDESREISLQKIDETPAEEAKEASLENETENTNGEANCNATEATMDANETETLEEALKMDTQDIESKQMASIDPTTKQRMEETRAMEEEQDLKKQKTTQKHDVIEELEEHLERKNNKPKESKRAFGPLTPSSERPLVLPGGRRWYRPKDAYNDEFIAETLSAQAEIITGTTLGCRYESPLLGYDARVNFMKYQRPERKIDLNKSEVYKVIHHIDRQPIRGIEVRPPVVPAEADIRKIL